MAVSAQNKIQNLHLTTLNRQLLNQK